MSQSAARVPQVAIFLASFTTLGNLIECYGQSYLGKHHPRRIRSLHRDRRQSIFPARCGSQGISKAQRDSHGVPVEEQRELLHPGSERQKQSRRRLVLSRAEIRGLSNQGLRRVLEGREGREVNFKTPGEFALRAPALDRDHGYTPDY